MVNKYRSVLCFTRESQCDDLKIFHLMDLNSMKIPLLRRTLMQSIVWIVQHPRVIQERNPEFFQNFGPWVFERRLRLIYRMQSTREPSCKSTYLTAWNSKGHSMSHSRSLFMMPHDSLARPRFHVSMLFTWIRGTSKFRSLLRIQWGMPSEESYPNRHCL